jgi:hypothetical protein
MCNKWILCANYNKNGWNNVIDFLRSNLDNSIKYLLPRKKHIEKNL